MVVAEETTKKSTPFTYARVTIIDGEQGSGKSMSAVAIVVDATFKDISSVKMPDGEEVKAKPVLDQYNYPYIGYAKLFINGKWKTMKIPPKSIVRADGVRIIYNGHLHGIRYAHMELIDIIKHLNDGTLKDCYLIIDEAYIGGDKREGMSPLVRVLTKLSKQLRKRHIHLIMCTPDSSELDQRFQKIEVEHIVCSYDEDTAKVTKFITNRKKYKKTRIVDYDAIIYRKYYDTDEIYEIPEVQMQRALAMASMGDIA